MKKIFSVIALSIFLIGCTIPFTKTEEGPQGVTRGKKIPAVKQNPPVSTGDFYFESTKNGLILKLINNDNFSQKLSQNPIESADITDGILTFIEKTKAGPQTQVFNLEPLAEKLNQ